MLRHFQVSKDRADVIASLGQYWTRVKSFLLPPPFGSSGKQGRTEERQRRVLLSALAAGGAKAFALLTVLISVPLTLGYLGVERYGLWMTISSVTAVLGFADFGIGNGLLNYVSEANGKEDRRMAQAAVSSAFFMLLGVAMLLALMFVVLYRFVPWADVFNVSSSDAVAEAGPAMAVFVAFFILNIPLGIVSRVQIGYQESYTNSIWQAIGNVLGLLMLLVVVNFKGSLAWLVLALVGAPAVATALNGVQLFRRRRWLIPKWRRISRNVASRILRLGVLFFVLQVAVTLAFSLDNLIVARLLGPEAVSEYAVVNRLFSLAPMVIGLFLAPLWPAYGEAVARGDTGWAKRALWSSLWLSLLVVGLPSLIIVLFGNTLLNLWVGPSVTATFSLLLAIGLFTVATAIGTAIAMFLNGISRITFQVVTGSVMAAAALALKIVFGQRMGLPGIAWGTLLAYTVFTLVPMAIYIPRLVRSIDKTNQPSAPAVPPETA